MTKPIIMWAAIVKSKRSEWIDYLTLAALKREAVTRYCEVWDCTHSEVDLSRVRFARVEVKEIEEQREFICARCGIRQDSKPSGESPF